MGSHPNDFLSWDSQVGVPKFPQLRLPRLWGCITWRANLRLQWRLKQNCSPYQEISNDILHVVFTQGNRVDSRLLVVGNQIGNLTPGLSFGHNLCFKYPNGQYKLILDIYISISFQWYKEFFEAMSFDPYNCALKNRESTWDSNSQHGNSLGSVRAHSLTLFAFLGACEVTPRSPSWPATLQPLALVTNPRLGLRHP
jgi:hypothetical protein